MKLLSLSIPFFLIVLFASACGEARPPAEIPQTVQAAIPPTIEEAERPPYHLLLLETYTKRRCKTCNTIEARTKKVLSEHFAQELQEHKLVYQFMSVEEADNYELAKKFEASGTGLYLQTVTPTTEHILDLTDFAFSSATKDDSQFEDELKLEIENALNQLAQ